MKDDSFINLTYFLVLEKNLNNTLNPINMNIINKKKINNNNIINNKFYKQNKISSINQPSKNSKKKIDIQRAKTNQNTFKKDNLDAINGGNFIIETKDQNQNNIVKPNQNNKIIHKQNLNINIFNTNSTRPIQNINYNINNNADINKKNSKNNNNINNKQMKLVTIEKKDLLNSFNKNKTLTQNKINNTTGFNYSNNKNNNIINNEGKNEKKLNNGKNIINKNKNLNINVDNNNNINLNKNFSLVNTASPKQTATNRNLVKNSIKHLSLTNPSGITSYLNISGDCGSFSNYKNDLNLTMNTIDTSIQEPQYKILSNNSHIDNPTDIFSKEYISKLNLNEYEYDTFCQAIITTGLSEKKMSLSKYSENFPAPCGHELCSKLPALEPNVLDFYYNRKKSHNVDLKQDATSHLIFPLGIKLCVDQDYHNQELVNEPLINTIYNEKGDIYYIASLIYYRKISIKNYNKIFNINPIDVFNKFKMESKNKKLNINLSNSIKFTVNNEGLNANNDLNINRNKDKINNLSQLIKNDTNNLINNNGSINNYTFDNNSVDFKEDNNELLMFNPNDIIYIPECLTLVSRFPFFNQLSKCLKIIIYMRRQIINGDNNQKITNNISLFINHLINQIPIGNNKLNILFYTPLNIEPITLYNPYIYNFGNFTCPNIFSILSVENIITIFLLVLLEQKIIFVDTSHLLLSSITFFFINLIYPLAWVNTYEPLLCLSTIRYIQSITPFIMGGNESLILYAYYKKYIIYNENLENIDKSNIVFVSLTNNLISCDCYNLITNKKGQSRKFILKYLGLPDLPKKIEKKLYNHLNEIEKMEQLQSMNEKLKTFFCRIMVYILDDYADYLLLTLDKPIFNKENYLMNKKEENHSFYKELLSTQLFTQFIYFENEIYKNKKQNSKFLKQKEMTYGSLHDGIYKDYSFYNKNKKIIEELRIMIKKRKMDKIRKPLLSAKKFVKNIGQIKKGTSENKKKEIIKKRKNQKILLKQIYL